MRAIIKPGKMQGIITPPASKSIMQRACAAALMYKGCTKIINPGHSQDDVAALNIIQQLGATVNTLPDNQLEIISNGIMPVNDTIHCGESGLSARLFAPIAALCEKEITITGSGSLLHRPMTEYINALPKLGVSITAASNCLPLNVHGPLQPANITIDGSISSQFVSGLLMVYAFTATQPVTIQVTDLNSKPYVALTLQILQDYGLQITNDNYSTFTIQPAGLEKGLCRVIDIETDWSAAANFMVAIAMGAELQLRQLNIDSLQADVAILQVINLSNESFHFDATDSPDLIPILSIYAGYCTGTSSIKGLNRLSHKESNRVESTTEMLTQFGIQYTVQEDTLTVAGGNGFKACTINPHNDHRIAMAASIAALHADGQVTITDAASVQKSYPDFFETLINAGVDCEIVN